MLFFLNFCLSWTANNVNNATLAKGFKPVLRFEIGSWEKGGKKWTDKQTKKQNYLNFEIVYISRDYLAITRQACVLPLENLL